MDLTAAVAFSLLLLVTGGSNQPELDSSQENISTLSNSSTTCSCCPPASTAPVDPPATPTASPPPPPGLLAVDWTRPCEGGVYLAHMSINSSSSPVCHSETSRAAAALREVCKHKKGCDAPPRWFPGAVEEEDGYTVNETGASKALRCKALRVECKAEVSSDVQAQLQAYKVVTALLCCLLLILLLIRFTRPTVKALQKRLSDRRQSRWIGPTQSHSVSYHRGKAAVRCNDGEKRLSYPGNTSLDRLTAGDSRDPPSSRNSYNF